MLNINFWFIWYLNEIFCFKQYLNEIKLLSFIWSCSAAAISSIFTLNGENQTGTWMEWIKSTQNWTIHEQNGEGQIFNLTFAWCRTHYCHFIQTLKNHRDRTKACTLCCFGLLLFSSFERAKNLLIMGPQNTKNSSIKCDFLIFNYE